MNPLVGFNLYETRMFAQKIQEVAEKQQISVAMDGQRLFSVSGFQKWLYTLGIGKQFQIEIYREGETLLKTIKIIQRPASAKPL